MIDKVLAELNVMSLDVSIPSLEEKIAKLDNATLGDSQAMYANEGLRNKLVVKSDNRNFRYRIG